MVVGIRCAIFPAAACPLLPQPLPRAQRLHFSKRLGIRDHSGGPWILQRPNLCLFSHKKNDLTVIRGVHWSDFYGTESPFFATWHLAKPNPKGYTIHLEELFCLVAYMCILVCSGCCNKISQTGWLTSNSYLFLKDWRTYTCKVPDHGACSCSVWWGPASSEVSGFPLSARRVERAWGPAPGPAC